MFKKPHSVVSLTAGVSLLLLGCGDGSGNGNDANADAETQTLRIGHISHEEGDYELTLQALNEALQEATDGRVEIETYPNGQLGGDIEMLEQVQSGNIEGGVLNSGAVSTAVPMIGGLELPYLFDSVEHARSAIDGEIGEFLREEATEAGLVPLGFWEVGFKNITNNVRPLETADDAAGVHIRVIENPIAVSTYSALGMDTTPLPFPEVYTAVEQGVVDGFEGPYNSFVNGGLHEIQDYVSEVQMVYSTATFLISQEAFDSLSTEDQETLMVLAAEHVDIQRGHSEERMERDRQTTVDAGVEIIETDSLDLESFQEATQSVRDNATEYEELLNLADSTR